MALDLLGICCRHEALCLLVGIIRVFVGFGY